MENEQESGNPQISTIVHNYFPSVSERMFVDCLLLESGYPIDQRGSRINVQKLPFVSTQRLGFSKETANQLSDTLQKCCEEVMKIFKVGEHQAYSMIFDEIRGQLTGSEFGQFKTTLETVKTFFRPRN